MNGYLKDFTNKDNRSDSIELNEIYEQTWLFGM